MQCMAVNYLGLALGAVLNMVLGMIWYSPFLAGKPWMKALNIKKMEAPGIIHFVWAFVFGLAYTVVLAFLLDALVITNWMYAAGFGAFLALGLKIPQIGSGVLWDRVPFQMLWIHGGYFVVYFAILGAMLTLF